MRLNDGRNKAMKFNQSNADAVEVIDNTIVFEGNISAFLVISDCTLGAGCVDVWGDTLTSVSGASFTTGQVVLFPATAIQLTTGTIWVYYDKH